MVVTIELTSRKSAGALGEEKFLLGGGGGGGSWNVWGGGKLERLGGGEVGTFGGGGSFPPLDRTLPAAELFPHYRCHPERNISLQNTRLTLRVYLCRCSGGSENTKGLRACSRAADKDSSLTADIWLS